jgi:hypothetical protein
MTGQHYTYLLRIWRADANQPWRFTVRRVGAEETHYFPSLTAFVSMLWEQLNKGK